VIQYFTVPRFVFTAIDAGQRSKPIKFVDQNGMGIVRTWKAATRADHSPQSPVFGKQFFKLKVQSPL